MIVNNIISNSNNSYVIFITYTIYIASANSAAEMILSGASN